MALARPNSDARLALHLTTVTSKNTCARTEAAPACGGVLTRGDLYPTTYYGYLLVMKGNASDGLGGLQCGIQYDGAPQSGVDIFEWHNCATLEFSATGWPGSGGSNLLTWDTLRRCQRGEPAGPGSGVTATAGYFYLAAYSPDLLQIIPRPVDGKAKVASCNSEETLIEGPGLHHDPSFLGSARFSSGAGGAGYNPCDAPPILTDCTIQAFGYESPDSLITYTITAFPPGSNFSWRVTGDGSVVGAGNSSSLLVHASNRLGGTIDVDVTVSDLYSTYSCSRHVVLSRPDPPPPPPSCGIGAPSSCYEGMTCQIYTFGGGQVHDINWQISGEGALTTPPDQSSIVVLAGNPGSFTVTVHFTTGVGQVLSCSQTVSVSPLVCQIYGSDPVEPFSTHFYQAYYQADGATYRWQISGNGSIVGSDQNASIRVDAGDTGAFTVSLNQTRNGVSHACSKTVTVTPAVVTRNANSDAKLLVHLLTVTSRNACDGRGAPRCTQVLNAGALAPTTYFAYLMVADGNAAAGIAGMQCGIDYNGAPGVGVDVFGWTLCATLEFDSTVPNAAWPASGAGTLITWDSDLRCQRNEPGGVGSGVTAAAGYFYLAAYSADQFRIVPRPIDGKAKVADCHSIESLIGGVGFPPGAVSQLGSAAFSADGGVRGYNPCGTTVGVQTTTWSRIKGMFARPVAH